MKNILIPLLFVLPLLTMAQRRPKIKGNRTVTEYSETLPAFNAIELLNDLDITLKKSSTEGYDIKADDNLIDILKFEVIDSTLVISSFYDIVSKKKLDITLHFLELKNITLQDGKLFSNGRISSDELYINTFGNSDLKLDVNGFMVDVIAEDNSKVELNLDIDSLNVQMKHKSDGLVYSMGGAKTIALSDNASLTIEGSSETATVTMTGNTKLKADKLEVAEVNLSNHESGFARVNAYRTIRLSTNGNSKTHLYGNPKITIEEFLNSAQLLKKGD